VRGAIRSRLGCRAVGSGGHKTTIDGLVPDGNATVTLVLASGALHSVPVVDNVFEATVRGRVGAIIDRDIHGRVVRKALGLTRTHRLTSYFTLSSIM
jgi:hypothetical protein